MRKQQMIKYILILQLIFTCVLGFSQGASTEKTLKGVDFGLDTANTSLRDLRTTVQQARRPSQGTGRTYRTANTAGATATTTLMTVTVNKKFYLTTLIVTCQNSSIISDGSLLLQDAGVTIIPFYFPAAGTGAAAAVTQLQGTTVSFPEPAVFDANVVAVENLGTLTFAITLIGYEE